MKTTKNERVQAKRRGDVVVKKLCADVSELSKALRRVLDVIWESQSGGISSDVWQAAVDQAKAALKESKGT